MDALFQPEAWGSPAGVGIFLVLLGAFIYILSLAEKNKKDTK